ncbi:MAG TPA: hypothetical protein VGC02_00390 [Methanobacterium sp.]
MSTNPTIEKLFYNYRENMGESPGGFLGLLNPESLEIGDPKSLGKEIQRGADILESGIQEMDFKPLELEKGKAGSRLKEAVRIYSLMGKEIEQMTEHQPKEYHLYVIALLIDIISALLNHIEISKE